MTFVKYMLNLVVLLFLFQSAIAQPNERSGKYQISVWGMNIGEFTVGQKMDGSDITIEAVTDVNVKMIFTYRVKYVQRSLYKNGILWNTNIDTFKNGKIYSNTHLERQADNYLLTKDGEKSIINGTITYSGSLLYFQEPKLIGSIYNERNGEINSLINLEDINTYAIVDKKGKKTNKYVYQEGILMSAELIHSLATVYLKRIM